MLGDAVEYGRAEKTKSGRDAVIGRIHAAAFTAVLAGFALAAPHAAAQDYPMRPVTVIVPSTAGGGTDINARIIGDQLSKELGQPFVIDDRPGAGSVVGTLAAAKASPDGYTLLAGLIADMAVNPSLFANLPYDPVKDFVPVAMLSKYPFVVVVSNSFPAHSIKELIDLAKAKPGEINYASAGNGTGQHLSMELFKLTTGINLTHVPYRGAQPAYSDVMSGRVPVFFDNLASGLGPVKAGTVRALAVTGTARSPLLPDVPTVAEAGVPGYQYYVWFGLWAPANTPQPIIDKLHAAVTKALADPAVKERLNAVAGEPFDMPLADITPFVKTEIAKWADVVKRGGVTVEQ
jgi:tripartite-type tricarboxylate transporter receptor subunit TctC